jgi:hypothetical protein
MTNRISFEFARFARKRRALSAAAAFFVVWGSSAVGSAQECLLPPTSVPGIYGPPLWYGTGAPGVVVRSDLDDPRWGGAPLTSMANDGVGSTIAYRALVHGDELSVSFQVLADDTGPGDGDIIYLGLTSNSGGTIGKIVAIYPRDAGSPDPVAMNAGLDYQLFEKTSATGSWAAGSGTPATWLQSSLAPGSPSVYTWRNSPEGAVWGINLKVNLATFGIAATSNFHMGFAATVVNSGGAVDFHTPDYASGTTLASSTLLPADASTWPTYLPRGTACPAGVSVVGIGTTSASGRTWVDNSANTFFADVQNIPAPVSLNKIRARFSIANWGSTVADPNAGWVAFSQSTAGDGYVPDAAHPGWAAPAPGMGAGTARITHTCTVPSGSTYCPVITASSPNRDQCLLVELKGAPGTGTTIKFQNAAMRQNMTFAALSELDRDATISIKGLQQITGQALDRDVYLYVQTTNMPEHGNSPLFLPVEQMAKAKRYAENPPMLPQPDRQPGPDVAGAVVASADKLVNVPVKDESQLPLLTANQALMQVWPTYMVHVYYDTGKKRDIAGTKRPVLAPMVPFGFFLSHNGPLYGFTHELRGLAGVTLQEIAPNFYRLRIKNEGAARIATHITAEERPASEACSGGKSPCCRQPPVNVYVTPKGCYCGIPGRKAEHAALDFLAALPLVAFALRRRRRSR